MSRSYALIIGMSELDNLGLFDAKKIQNKKDSLNKMFRSFFSHSNSFYRRTLLLPSTCQRNRMLGVQLVDIHHYNLDQLSNIKIALYRAQLENKGELEGRDAECMRILDTLEQIYEIVHERVDEDVKRDKELMISIDKVLMKIAADEKKLIKSLCKTILDDLNIIDEQYLSELAKFVINRTQFPKKFADLKIKASDEVDTAVALLLIKLSNNKANPKAMTKEVNAKLKEAKKSIANAQSEIASLRQTHQPEIEANKQALSELNDHMQETVKDISSLKYRIEYELIPRLNPAILDSLPKVESPSYIPPPIKGEKRL